MPDETMMEEALEGLVQLRFANDDGELHDLNAAEMAEVLHGLVEFTSHMARAGMFGDGMPPEVRVRAPQQGSVILEALFQWASENPEMANGALIGAGGLVSQGINIGIRKLRGEEPSDFEHLDNGDVKVTWPNNKVDQVSKGSWDKLRAMKRPTRKSLRKIMSPLSDDVAQLEVRDGRIDAETGEILQSEPAVTAERQDYQAAAYNPDEVDDHSEVFDAEAQFGNIDFRPGEKWRVHTLHGNRSAIIEDEEFLLALDRGMALHKNDIFDVTIREERTTTNGRTSTTWALTQVQRKRRGDTSDDVSPNRSSEAE